MIQTLFLNHNVYFCVAQGHGIFLDLNRDTYSAVAMPDYLADRVRHGRWSHEDLSVALESNSELPLQEGLLTRSESGTRLSSFTAIPRPSEHLFGEDDQRAFGVTANSGLSVRFTPADLVRVVRAAHRASRSLRTLHISSVVETVRSRKARASRALDLDTLRRETAVFRLLRPWYPRAYVCLFDALALLEFLADTELFPDWVFGVQAEPFGAHCWLQTDDVLINEGSEYAGQFVPIMRV